MANLVFSPPSRFHMIGSDERPWLFDERDLGLYSLEGISESELSEFKRSLEEVHERPSTVYHTRSRISNLKLALSNRCPSNCAYCFRPRGPMPRPRPGLIRDLLEAMIYSFGRDAKSYTVTFNLASEPLADLDQLAELSSLRDEYLVETGKPIEIYVCTSATILAPEALEALAHATNGRLVISVDGPEEAHDRFRKDTAGCGTYGRTQELTAWGKERGMRLEAQAVLTRACPEPDSISRHLLDLGFNSVTMKPVRAGFDHEFREADLPVLFSSYDRLFSQIENSLIADDTSLLAALKNDFALRPLWKLVFGIKAEGRCFWGSTHILADAAGDYYPCDSVIGRPEFRCGSLEEGVDWARFHADVSWRSRPGCGECWARSLCGGTCYVNGLALTGDHLAVDPIECAMSRYFAEKCLGLMIAMTETGQDPPYGLKDVLLGRTAM